MFFWYVPIESIYQNIPLPLEMTDVQARKATMIEECTIKLSVPNNPFECPDLNEFEVWTETQRETYFNFLFYEKGYCSLRKYEEEFFNSWCLQHPQAQETVL